MAFLSTANANQGSAQEAYVDEFTGTSVRPEWRIDREDPNRYGLVEGNYLLLVSNPQYANTFVKSIRGFGDFVVELAGTADFIPTRFKEGLWEGQSCIILGVGFDKETRIPLRVCTTRSYFSKEIGKESNTIERWHDVFKRFLIRLQKNGARYTGTATIDGNEIQFGPHFMPRPPSAIYFNAATNSEHVAEGGVMIDRISITPN